MNLFQHLFNSGEKYIFIDNQQPKQIDFREPQEIRICLYKLDVLQHHTCLGECIMFQSFHNCCQSFLSQTQTWIKEANEKKIQKCKIYVTKKQKRLRPVYL